MSDDQLSDLDYLRRLDEQPGGDDSDSAESARPRRRFFIILIGLIISLCLIGSCIFAYSFFRQSINPDALAAALTGVAQTDVSAAGATRLAETPTSTDTACCAPTPTLEATATPEPTPSRGAALTEIVGEVQIRAEAEAEWRPVIADTLIQPGTSVLTGQNSRVKIVLSEAHILRLSSQTQFTLRQVGGTEAAPMALTQLDFGKVWAIMASPFAGQFEIQLPVGIAAVRGSFMSAEYNSTTNGIVVACLEGSCYYLNSKGAVDLTTHQQAVSVAGSAPAIRPISANQLADWRSQNVPEVLTLTPTATLTSPPTETPLATATFTETPTRTLIPSKTPRPSRTPTNTRTPRVSNTPGGTSTFTPTAGPSPTPDVPAKVAFTLQPTAAPVSAVIKVEVAIQDAHGTPVTESSATVSLAIGANGGGGKLAGVTTVKAVNGVARFEISIDKPGAYTLVATSAGLESATSNAFDVSGSAVLFVISGLPANVTAGQSISITVTAVNSEGGVATDYLGTVKFQASDSQATLPTDYTFSANDRGGHTFTVVFNTAETQTLKVIDTRTPTLVGYAGTNVSPGP